MRWPHFFRIAFHTTTWRGQVALAVVLLLCLIRLTLRAFRAGWQ
jgi:hypothetical protein